MHDCQPRALLHYCSKVLPDHALRYWQAVRRRAAFRVHKEPGCGKLRAKHAAELLAASLRWRHHQAERRHVHTSRAGWRHIRHGQQAAGKPVRAEVFRRRRFLRHSPDFPASRHCASHLLLHAQAGRALACDCNLAFHNLPAHLFICLVHAQRDHLRREDVRSL